MNSSTSYASTRNLDLNERDFNRVLADSDISADANRFVNQVTYGAEAFTDGDPVIEIILSMANIFGHRSRSSHSPTSIKYDAHARRWEAIRPNAIRQIQDLYEPLMNIMNCLLIFADRSSMVYFMSHDTYRLMDNGNKLMKTDLAFVYLNYMISKLGNGMTDNMGLNQRFVDSWQTAADYSAEFVSNVCLDRDIKQGREWLMVYAKEYLGRIRNRRWLFCLLFTETTLEVYSVDRMGIYSTTVVKYHEDPVLFAQAVLGFASMDRVRASFDNAIHFDKTAQLVATVYHAPKSFTLELPKKTKLKRRRVTATIFPSQNIHEKIYGEAANSYEPIPPDRVVHIHPKFRGYPRTLWLNNTAPFKHPADVPLPRMSTKLTLMPLMKSITDSPSKKQLLRTLMDGVKAHKALSESGILHGDLAPRKLMFTAGTDDGAVLMCEIER